eukprot:COSAG01_NODE_290_length_19382_cov_22.903801_2_plen_127_part_00
MEGWGETLGAAGLTALAVALTTALYSSMTDRASVRSRARHAERRRAQSQATIDEMKAALEILRTETAGQVGLPVAGQLAAMPWRDEVCLRAMKELELARGAGLRKELAASSHRVVCSAGAAAASRP